MTFLPLERIAPATGDAGNDRQDFTSVAAVAAIAELAESIAAHGLAQPVTVRPVADLTGERWEIVAGERRYRAHVLLAAAGRFPRGGQVGMVECNVRAYSDREASAIMLAENLSRADLKPLEEAAGYASRMSRFGIDAAAVAEMAGTNTFRVNQRLQLLKLTPEARKLVESSEAGALPVGHAARMADLDPNRQALALAAWAESGGTIHKAGWGEIVGNLMAEQSQEAMFSADSFLQVAEMVAGAAKREPSTKALRRHLQAAVRAMEGAGIAPELCAEIRATWATSWNIAAAKSA
jgi:ParB/RepB/Spo0J family partition protein